MLSFVTVLQHVLALWCISFPPACFSVAKFNSITELLTYRSHFETAAWLLCLLFSYLVKAVHCCFVFFVTSQAIAAYRLVDSFMLNF